MVQKHNIIKDNILSVNKSHFQGKQMKICARGIIYKPNKMSFNLVNVNNLQGG